MRNQNLLVTIYQNHENLYQQVIDCVSAGADVNKVTEYSESALRVASNNGRFDVVKLLLDNGADASQLEWNAIHFAAVYEPVESLRRIASDNKKLLEAQDFWSRTPFLLSILRGDIEICSCLLDLGADKDAVGRCEKTVFQYAIQNDDAAMLDWLVCSGFDLSNTDRFLTTPLIEASEKSKINCARYLIDSGVDIYESNHIPTRAIEAASNKEIVDMLLAKGDDINDVSEKMHQQIIGMGDIDSPTVSNTVYMSQRDRMFGVTNPEQVYKEFWNDMIRSGVGAWHARDKYEDKDHEQPVWCFNRFGRTTTILPDGRIVVIAGEHEDHYDPDFCIYNDVVVFESSKEPKIYCYPETEFPPTDFHTATLVDNFIFIIGNLGYQASRQVGETPVFKLDLKTMQIIKLSVSGDSPGWISNHKSKLSGTDLLVTGGEVLEETKTGHFDLVSNSYHYTLSLNSLEWSKTNNTTGEHA